MSTFETWINSFAGISPYLPEVIRWSSVAVIALIALVPFSLVLLVIDNSTRSVIERLLNYLKSTSSDLFEGIKFHVNACTEIVQKFTQNNSVNYGFSPDLKHIDVSKAQDAVDLIDQHGKTFPETLASRLGPQTDHYEEFEERLDKLESMAADGEPFEINIPDRDVLQKEYEDQRSGMTAIILWAPLLLLVLILNTFLLNVFFSELLPTENLFKIPWGKTTFKVQMSHIIALAFSAIEAGAGVFIASSFFERNERKIPDTSITHIMRWMAGISVFALVILEAAIYWQVSSRIKMPELAGLSMSFLDFVTKGWLSPLGPIVVFGLFISGHQITHGILLMRSTISMKKFKNELDNAHSKSVQTEELLSRSNAELVQSLQVLKEHQIALQNAPPVQPVESAFLSELEEKVSEANTVLDDFKSSYDFSEQSVVIEVAEEERKKVFLLMSLLLAAVAIAFAISIITMVPLLKTHSVLSNLHPVVIYCIPVFGILASLLIGYFWSKQFIMRIGEDIISHPKSQFLRIGLGLAVLFILALVVYICLIHQDQRSFVSFLAITACMAFVLFIASPSTRVMLDTLITLVQLLWRGIRIVVQWVTASLTWALSHAVHWILALMEVCSTPGRRIKQLIFGGS